jgi:hypothetical protein
MIKKALFFLLGLSSTLFGTTIYYTDQGSPDYERINKEMEKESQPRCECLGNLIIFAVIQENGQVMFKCENYDHGCREFGAMGFIFNGKMFCSDFHAEEVNNVKVD